MPPQGHNATIELIWQYGTIVFFEGFAMAEKQVKDYDKFNLRFPDGMRDAISERAKKNGRSMNSEIVAILADVMRMDSISKEALENSIDPRLDEEKATELELIQEKLIAMHIRTTDLLKQKIALLEEIVVQKQGE